MDMQLELALSTLVIPLALSFAVQRLSLVLKSIITTGVFIAWLISFFWIVGVPSLPPKEAIEWSIYIGAVFIIISLFLKSGFGQIILHALLSIVGAILIAWPVISHTPELQLFVELLFFLLIAGIISYRLLHISPASPALSIGISNAGLAIVAGLGGSLLIGQLSGALAASLGAFALLELYKKLEATQIRRNTTLLTSLLSLLMIIVARIYAELPLVSVVLLALSLTLGLSCRWKYASSLSLILTLFSIVWLLSTADKSSYY